MRGFLLMPLFAAFLCQLGGDGAAPPLADKGIFPDLDGKVAVGLPPGIDAGETSLLLDAARKVLSLSSRGVPLRSCAVQGEAAPGAYAVTGTVAEASVRAVSFVPAGGGSEGRLFLASADFDLLAPVVKEGTPLAVAAALAKGHDRDGDGIPDTADMLLGAHKVALNGAVYAGGYEKIGYPWGDVARDKGVCTDVVIRAMRNAGWDLQSLVFEDMKKSPKAYGGAAPDPNISHRRVKTLVKFFTRRFKSLGAALDAPGAKRWAPGDVVFIDTFPKKAGPDHIGVLSEETGGGGLPLVVNNWTYGFHESQMDLLSGYAVTHRFRLPVP